MKTLKQLAQEALDVQNASNLVGVINGMARAVAELRETLGDWTAADNHPIVKLWTDKIAHLTKYPQDYIGSSPMRTTASR